MDQAALILQRFERARAAHMELELRRFEAAKLRLVVSTPLDWRALTPKQQLKLQAIIRGRAQRRWFLKIRAGVVKFQARCRGVFVRGRWNSVLESREKWRELLRTNEAVVLTSMVSKTSRVSKSRGLFSAMAGLKSTKQRQVRCASGHAV